MIQTPFLDALIRDQVKVTIYLRNGVGINGRVLGHDVFSLQLHLLDGSECLVYKSEISNLKAAQHVELLLAGVPGTAEAEHAAGERRFNIYRRARRATR